MLNHDLLYLDKALGAEKHSNTSIIFHVNIGVEKLVSQLEVSKLHQDKSRSTTI